MICLNALWLAPIVLLAVLIVPHLTDEYTGKYAQTPDKKKGDL